MGKSDSHSSPMRVAIVSASRVQRETLKSLVEDNGQQVVGTAGFRDYFLRQEKLDADVLLVDLEKADDDALDRLEKLVEHSTVPILFNESPTIPSMPGPYRDEWANNLIGKLHDLARSSGEKNQPGLLQRRRYNTRGAHAFPDVLIVSRSRTRRRVIQLVMSNQGFRTADESAFTPDLVEKRIGAYDAVIIDEHNVGGDDEAVFRALTEQRQIPVQICNSSTIPAAPSARKLWGSQLAGKLIQLTRHHDKETKETTAAAVMDKTAGSGTDSAAHDHWGDRMARNLKLARSAMHEFLPPATEEEPQRAAAPEPPASKPDIDIPRPSLEHKTPETNTIPMQVASPQPAQPDIQSGREKKPSILDQLDISIEESKQESARFEKYVANEPHKDLKYLPPERAAVLRRDSAFAAELLADQSDEAVAAVGIAGHTTASPVSARGRISAAPDLIDASNFDALPVPPPPGPDYSSHFIQTAVTAAIDEIDPSVRFTTDVSTSTKIALIKAKAADKAAPNKAKSGLHDFDWNASPDRSNPFDKKGRRPVLFGKNPPGNKGAAKGKASKPAPKKSGSRWMNSLGGIKQLLPKIFN